MGICSRLFGSSIKESNNNQSKYKELKLKLFNKKPFRVVNAKTWGKGLQFCVITPSGRTTTLFIRSSDLKVFEDSEDGDIKFLYYDFMKDVNGDHGFELHSLGNAKLHVPPGSLDWYFVPMEPGNA